MSVPNDLSSQGNKMLLLLGAHFDPWRNWQRSRLLICGLQVRILLGQRGVEVFRIGVRRA